MLRRPRRLARLSPGRQGCGVDFARVKTNSSCIHLRSPKPVAARECLPHANRGDRAYVVCCSLAHDVVLGTSIQPVDPPQATPNKSQIHLSSAGGSPGCPAGHQVINQDQNSRTYLSVFTAAPPRRVLAALAMLVAGACPGFPRSRFGAYSRSAPEWPSWLWRPGNTMHQ